jgi:hypothetical protein
MYNNFDNLLLTTTISSSRRQLSLSQGWRTTTIRTREALKRRSTATLASSLTAGTTSESPVRRLASKIGRKGCLSASLAFHESDLTLFSYDPTKASLLETLHELSDEHDI